MGALHALKSLIFVCNVHYVCVDLLISPKWYACVIKRRPNVLLREMQMQIGKFTKFNAEYENRSKATETRNECSSKRTVYIIEIQSPIEICVQS